MADEISIKPKAESESINNSGQENQNANLGRSQLITWCAVGLGVSFFLPWANIFLVGQPSGFDLQKLGDEQRLLWLIPIFCAITIFAGVAKKSQQIAGQLTGILPFCVGIFWYIKIGSDLTRMLAYGAVLSLVFGAALFILARKVK